MLDMKINNETLASIIVNIIPVAIIIVDKNKMIVYGNHHAETIFAYKENELVGKPLSDLVPDRFKKTHDSGASEYMNCPKKK